MGFAENVNVAIEHRWTEDHNDRLPALATELRPSEGRRHLCCRRNHSSGSGQGVDHDDFNRSSTSAVTLSKLV